MCVCVCVCVYSTDIYLFINISKNVLCTVKYLTVYKYSSHIKSFSNIELGPQVYVVWEFSGSVVHGTEGVIYITVYYHL